MPSTPSRQAGTAAAGSNAAFSSPALTSPADDPTFSKPLTITSLHAMIQHPAQSRRATNEDDDDVDADYSLDDQADVDDSASDRTDEEKQRKKDADFVPSFSSPSIPDIITNTTSTNTNTYQPPSSPPSISSSPPPSSPAQPPQSQLSAKEIRASQLAQIRAAKIARDSANNSRKNSPAPPLPTPPSPPTPTPPAAHSHSQASTSAGRRDQDDSGSETASKVQRKRKASAEGNPSATGKRRKQDSAGEAGAGDDDMDVDSDGSSLSSLSDADAEGSEDGDAFLTTPAVANESSPKLAHAPSTGTAPVEASTLNEVKPAASSSSSSSAAIAPKAIVKAPSPSPPASTTNDFPQAEPSLADAFAAAKGEPASSPSATQSKSGVDPEVERTRARRLQSLYPGRSLEQCIMALNKSDWNVTAAMLWLDSTPPDRPKEAPVKILPPTNGLGGRAVAGMNGIHSASAAVGSSKPAASPFAPPPALLAAASTSSSKPAKRPIPRGAIMLGGAKKEGANGMARVPSVTQIRAEDIAPEVRASAMQELAAAGRHRDFSQSSSSSSSVGDDELLTPPIVPSSLRKDPSASNGIPRAVPSAPSLPNGKVMTPAMIALQARRAAEEAERARAKQAKARRKLEEAAAAAAAEEDEDDDGGSGMDEAEREAKQEQTALNWFNSCDETALMDTIGCNAAQASGIVALRPFASVQDVNTRLGDKRVKGVTPRLFHNCVELMAGYFEVDAILAKCERVGRMLGDAMADWDSEFLGVGASGGGGGGSSGSRTGSRAGTPALSNAGGEASTSKTVTAASSPLALSTSKPLPADEAAATAAASRSAVAEGKRKAWMSEQPASLAPGVVLKNYQLAGLNWLSLLYERKLSCILADEMGLGKTVQVISFFAHIKSLGAQGPHLVVVPSSVLENWSREFQTFAPDLTVVRYWGNQRERELLRLDLRESNDFDIMLCTYDTAAGGPNDHAFLRKKGFDCCVFDEGHVLKSRKSQKYEKLMRIRARWRLLLTGTPLQNNLQELVSLLNFIMPTYFSSAEEALSAIFKVKSSAQKNELSQQRIVRAKKMMQPFVLRRRKDKVLTELLSKTERIEYCDMTRVQKKLYSQALSRTRTALLEQETATQTRSAAAAIKRNKTSTSSHVLMDLRKAANHPLLFRTIFTEAKIAALAKDYIQEPDNALENLEHVKEDFAINSDAQLSFTANAWPYTRKHVLPNHEWMNSGKIKVLQRVLNEIKAKGDRAIIFSQFTTVLDILCVCLDIMGIKFVGFTGQTEVGDRQVLVDQFTNDKEIDVFLLSTKAGGLGINLVAANWVILFDQDFNPQNDKQAADRAYRIGQTKEVHVVRLISKGTIDEDILRLGQRKLELENRVAGGGGGDGDSGAGGSRDGGVGGGGRGGGDDDDEGDDAEGSANEQKVQRSLLTQLRDRVEQEGDDDDDDDDEEEQKEDGGAAAAKS